MSKKTTIDIWFDYYDPTKKRELRIDPVTNDLVIIEAITQNVLATFSHKCRKGLLLDSVVLFGFIEKAQNE
jgi:hypothetical protein